VTLLEYRLISLAAVEHTITYGRLAEEMGLRFRDLISALEQLMERDCKAGLPLLAAVCVSRLYAYMPANGFFIKARELGYKIEDEATFIINERAALRALYGGATPPR
jgi:hypothetical protein